MAKEGRLLFFKVSKGGLLRVKEEKNTRGLQLKGGGKAKSDICGNTGKEKVKSDLSGTRWEHKLEKCWEEGAWGYLEREICRKCWGEALRINSKENLELGGKKLRVEGIPGNLSKENRTFRQHGDKPSERKGNKKSRRKRLKTSPLQGESPGGKGRGTKSVIWTDNLWRGGEKNNTRESKFGIDCQKRYGRKR